MIFITIFSISTLKEDLRSYVCKFVRQRERLGKQSLNILLIE